MSQLGRSARRSCSYGPRHASNEQEDEDIVGEWERGCNVVGAILTAWLVGMALLGAWFGW